MNLQIDAAVVILYHPTQSVLDNIATYIKNVKSLYVIDNSTTEHPFLNQLSTFSNVQILHQGSNIGVAKGLNMALEKAYVENHSWLMTFDRLMRCGLDETRLSPEVLVKGDWKYIDTLEHNDFWWCPAKGDTGLINSQPSEQSLNWGISVE